MAISADEWRARMRRYAGTELHGLSDVYEAIALGAVEDDAVMEWLAASAGPRANPNLLFAAVHYRLLRAAAEGAPATGLAAYFGSLTPEPLPASGVYPAFRATWERDRDALAAILATRTTQTNEVGRCCYLLPAFVRAGERVPGPFAVIDAGTAAGLTLFLDRFACDYGEGRIGGAADSPVRLHTEVRGAMPPIAPMPGIISRAGIDLSPIDVNDDDAATWLRACIWPEHAERRGNLEGALAVAREAPPRIAAGNIIETLPALAAEAPPGAAIAVTSTNVLPYLSAEERARYAAVLADIARTRDLCWIAVEWPPFVQEAGFAGSFEGTEFPAPSLPLTLTTWTKGTRRDEFLAVTGAHGRWLRWLAE
ncbi:MAG: DUF2332 domain-containing protein [Dehalococcoidia bacterium]|nr:DUF2332 domain-containing protein [Dehalococcoidia bacterium]